MSPGKVIIHVGGPKTGTTAIQTALAENRSHLLSQSIFYPGTELHHTRILYPMRKIRGFEIFIDDDFEAWKILCSKIQQFDGTVVISSEGLMFAPHDVISEIVNDFGDARIEVLITARSPYEIVISQWQESVKAGDTISLQKFTEGVAQGPINSTSSSFVYWLIVDYVSAIKQWSNKIGVENVIVQCIDVTNSDETLRNFEALAEIPKEILVAAKKDFVNQSLSYSEAELLRMCNELLLNGRESNHLYNTVDPDVINEIVLRSKPVDDPKIQLPSSYYESIAPFVNTEVERILHSGARIVGDSSLLTRMPQTSGDSRSSHVKVDLDLIRIVLGHYLPSSGNEQ